jgi:ribonuclease BN (tRNA processing enzyme)
VYQDAGGACSGYLVEEGESGLLVDCGSGVFGKLRQVTDYFTLEAVVLSHLHSDHFLDLIPFAYALQYSSRLAASSRLSAGVKRETGGARPKLFAPPGAIDIFTQVTSTFGDSTLISRAFELSEYDPGDKIVIDDLEVRFSEVPHYIQTFAIDVKSRVTGKRITFAGDLGPGSELPNFARDTDLLLVEATLSEPDQGEVKGHLSAREAGEHGRKANAKQVMITHISDELDQESAKRDAEQGFGGEVLLARDLAELSL